MEEILTPTENSIDYLLILDIVFKSATICIAGFNAFFAVKIFKLKDKKDETEKEKESGAESAVSRGFTAEYCSIVGALRVSALPIVLAFLLGLFVSAHQAALFVHLTFGQFALVIGIGVVAAFVFDTDRRAG